MPVLLSLIPRRASGVFSLIVCSIAYVFACFFFKQTHPHFLIVLAAFQGIWLGVWAQDLHQFAGSHVVPRFATRMLGAYFVVLVASVFTFVLIALVHHDLFAIIGLLMAVVVTLSAWVLLIQSRWIAVLIPYGFFFLWIKLPDANKGGVVDLLYSSYQYPVSIVAILLGAAFLYAHLSKPVIVGRRSLRQQFERGLEFNPSKAGGTYGVNWLSTVKGALVGIVLTLVVLQFYEEGANIVPLGWMIAIVIFPAQNFGHVIGLAPRAWLAGVFSSRTALSSAVLARLLGAAAIFTVAGLLMSPITYLLGLELPQNFLSLVLASFAGGSLGLGLISSYSSNLEGTEMTFLRSIVLFAIYFSIQMSSQIAFEFLGGLILLFACAALVFLYKGHQRVARMEFTNF